MTNIVISHNDLALFKCSIYYSLYTQIFQQNKTCSLLLLKKKRLIKAFIFNLFYFFQVEKKVFVFALRPHNNKSKCKIAAAAAFTWRTLHIEREENGMGGGREESSERESICTIYLYTTQYNLTNFITISVAPLPLLRFYSFSFVKYRSTK